MLNWERDCRAGFFNNMLDRQNNCKENKKIVCDKRHFICFTYYVSNTYFFTCVMIGEQVNRFRKFKKIKFFCVTSNTYCQIPTVAWDWCPLTHHQRKCIISYLKLRFSYSLYKSVWLFEIASFLLIFGRKFILLVSKCN